MRKRPERIIKKNKKQNPELNHGKTFLYKRNMKLLINF